MKRLAYIFASLALLSGCVRVENQTPDLLKVEDKVKVDFNVQFPDVPLSTKSFADAPAVSNLYIAVFDKGGMLTEYAKATCANATMNTAEYSYSAELSVSDYPCTLHFIANGPAPSELRYGSEAEVLGSDAFLCDYGEDRYWQRIEVPSLKKDTDGKLESATKELIKKVALIRNFAKITVSENADNFELVGFYTMNTLDKGSTAAYNRNTGKFIEKYQNYTADELINTLHYNGNVPLSASLKTDLSDLIEIDESAGVGITYLFEREKPAANPIFVIVKGKYTGPRHDSSITEPTYYKIDLCDKSSDYFAFLRNFNYKINICEVTRDGSNSPIAAASAPGSSDISTSIEAKDLTNISDGTSRLFVDYTEMILVGNNPAVFRYKYIPDLTWSESDGTAKIFNDAQHVAITLEDESINGHAIIDQFQIAQSDDEDGYRSVTVTPTNITDAIKSSTVKIIGSCPDGVVEHDGKKVTVSPLQRSIRFTLRDSLNLQVYCNPIDIQKRIGEDISIFLKIEDGLPSSLFSLEFYLETDKLSLTSNALSVRTRRSIIPGNNEPAFQFLKTITWSEYAAAPTDNDGYKTFECKFKSNMAESASKVYVFNPHFRLGKTSFSNYTPYKFLNLTFSKTSNVHEADPETFSFTMDQLPDVGNVTATLYNLEPATTETRMTKLKTNSDGSADYEIDNVNNLTTTVNLVINNYEGNAKVVLNAYHFAQEESASVAISKGKFSNPVWSGKPMNAGDALTFTFKMDAAPRTNAESGASVGRAIVVLDNAVPASDEAHLKRVPDEANTYYYTPYGTDNASVAEATQTIKLTAVEKGTVTISVSADHFAEPLQSEIAPLPALTAPTITEGTVTAKTISVSWNAITDAAGYTIYYLHNGKASDPVSLGSSVTSYKFEWLDPENDYTICVIAKGDDVNYIDSVPGAIEITTHSQKTLRAPVVTFDKSTATAISLTFNWTCEDESHVQSYDIYLDDVKVKTEKVNTYTATGLTKGTTHTLSVVAIGDNDEYLTSDKSNIAQGTTKNSVKLDKPTVVFKEVLKNSLTFTWDAVSNATGYQVSTDGTSWTNVGNVTTYTLSDLSKNTSYTLYVRATSNDSSYETSDSGNASGKTAAWWREETVNNVLQLDDRNDSSLAEVFKNTPANSIIRLSYFVSKTINVNVKTAWYSNIGTIQLLQSNDSYDYFFSSVSQNGLVFETTDWNAVFQITLVQIIYP